MSEMEERIAWVSLPTEDEVRSLLPSDTPYPYDFGFLGGMTRLCRAHKRIAGPIGDLSAEIMFAPGHLERHEREMIAAVATAAQDCHY